MIKKYILFPLMILAGIFGPFFGIAQEGRTKHVSLEQTAGTRHVRTLESRQLLPLIKTALSVETDVSPCEHTSELYEKGEASWYGPGFNGRKMANGRIFNMNAYTVAHRELPLGTRICISNPENGKSVHATVTDRGPYAHGRIIDLSKQVAKVLDIMENGVAPVRIYLRNT